LPLTVGTSDFLCQYHIYGMKFGNVLALLFDPFYLLRTVRCGVENLFVCLGATATWPLSARAQQSAMPVVGLLDQRSPEEFAGRSSPRTGR
jgi:hypothetical protein